MLNSKHIGLNFLESFQIQIPFLACPLGSFPRPRSSELYQQLFMFNLWRERVSETRERIKGKRFEELCYN